MNRSSVFGFWSFNFVILFTCKNGSDSQFCAARVLMYSLILSTRFIPPIILGDVKIKDPMNSMKQSRNHGTVRICISPTPHFLVSSDWPEADSANFLERRGGGGEGAGEEDRKMRNDVLHSAFGQINFGGECCLLCYYCRSRP